MKNKWIGIGWSALKGSVELLLGLPLLLIMAVYALPDDASIGLWIATLPLCYAAGFAGGSFLSLGRMYQLLIFVSFIAALEAFIMFGTTYACYIALPVAALLAYRGVRLVTVPWNALFPVSFYAMGMIVYFISSIAFPFFREFQPYLPLLLWGGLASLAITLLLTNQGNLKQETLSGDKEPVLAAAVVWQNRILVLIVLGLILIVVLFRKLQQAVLWLKEQLLAWLRELLSHAPEPPAASKVDNAPMNSIGLGGGGQPAPWLQWLEKAAMIMIGAALVILLAVVLYIVFKRLLKLLKRWYMRLLAVLNRKELRKGAGGYEDDVESLMHWQELRDQVASRMKSWFPHKPEHRTKWEDLKDNRERVRYLYRAWIQKAVSDGYPLQRYLTPKETSQDIQRWDKKQRQTPDSLVALYEQVRYGEKPVTDMEVTSAKQSLEKKPVPQKL